MGRGGGRHRHSGGQRADVEDSFTPILPHSPALHRLTVPLLRTASGTCHPSSTPALASLPRRLTPPPHSPASLPCHIPPRHPPASLRRSAPPSPRPAPLLAAYCLPQVPVTRAAPGPCLTPLSHFPASLSRLTSPASIPHLTPQLPRTAQVPVARAVPRPPPRHRCGARRVHLQDSAQRQRACRHLQDGHVRVRRFGRLIQGPACLRHLEPGGRRFLRDSTHPRRPDRRAGGHGGGARGGVAARHRDDWRWLFPRPRRCLSRGTARVCVCVRGRVILREALSTAALGP